MNGRLLIVASGLIRLDRNPIDRPGEARRLLADRRTDLRPPRVRSGIPGVRWLPDGSGYTMLEGSKDASGGQDLVQYDAATGKREILVPAAHLVPPRESAPLSIHGYSLSKDRRRS